MHPSTVKLSPVIKGRESIVLTILALYAQRACTDCGKQDGENDGELHIVRLLKCEWRDGSGLGRYGMCPAEHRLQNGSLYARSEYYQVMSMIKILRRLHPDSMTPVSR